MFLRDGTTSGWSGNWIAAKRHTLAPLSRLSPLRSSWHWSGWQWRSIWFRSEVPRICDLETVRRYLTLSRGKGIIDTPSNHSVNQTVERLKGVLQAKGVTLFALIDHSGEAEKGGMKMPPTKLLIFGSPKGGTLVMIAAPTIAIDLPLKILVWEDSKGKVWVSYNSQAYLQARHGVPQNLLQNVAVVETLAA